MCRHVSTTFCVCTNQLPGQVGGQLHWDGPDQQRLRQIAALRQKYGEHVFVSPEAVCLAAAYLNKTSRRGPAYLREQKYRDVHLWLLHEHFHTREGAKTCGYLRNVPLVEEN